MSDLAPVRLDISPDGAAIVTLDRPEKRNAFDELMVSALAETFETLRAADHVRVVFLKGSGRSFCAGADLEWMERQGRHSQEDNEADAFALAEMLRALHELPILTVALVHGGAYGGGSGLVAACDTAIAVAGSHFAFTEVRLGLTPATISPYVVKAIGARQARALFATGRPFDAERALAIGLIHEIVPDLDGLSKAQERLADLAFSAAPGAVGAAKQLVADVAGRAIDVSLSRDTARRIAERRAGDEGREGLAAFLEKRAPAWAPQPESSEVPE
jgi:methylglutaconyl-CoA hydratase